MLQKRRPGVERHRSHCRNIHGQRISFPRRFPISFSPCGQFVLRWGFIKLAEPDFAAIWEKQCQHQRFRI